MSCLAEPESVMSCLAEPGMSCLAEPDLSFELSSRVGGAEMSCLAV